MSRRSVFVVALIAGFTSASLLPRLPRIEPRSPAPRRGGPRPSGAPVKPGNSTAHAMDMLKRDFLFYERLFVLFARSLSRTIDAAKGVLSRLLNFPPRVLVVSLQGVIAADEEAARLSLQTLAPAELLDPSLLDDTGSYAIRAQPAARSNGRSDVINLASCEKLLTRAFQSPGVRAVCLLINSPGGSPVQSSLIYGAGAFSARLLKVGVLAMGNHRLLSDLSVPAVSYFL